METKLSIFIFYHIFTCFLATRDFGDPREDCRDAATLGKDYCSRRRNRKFRFQRSISGKCNNLLTGNGTAGAADTPVARLVDANYVGTDIPLGHPAAASTGDVPSAQAVSDRMFRIRDEDNGNRRRVSHVFMTFGQFMDHDFAYVIHGPTDACPESCKTRAGAFDYPCNNIVPGPRRRRMSQCVRFSRSFAICDSEVREQLNNVTQYVDGSMIYGSTDRELKLLRNGTTAFMKVLETDKGTLLPLNLNNNEPCQERGGCFLAGDRRVNENTALAGMHTIWVRLHNVYARLISEEFDKNPQSFESASKRKKRKFEITFQESRKMVIATLQRIFYEEWLVTLGVTLPVYQGYKPNVKAEVSNGFITAAFRFGHSLVPNFFPQLNPDFSRARQPLSVRESFFNNRPIFDNGIEETVHGLFGDRQESEAENFDTVFSESIAKTLFISPDDRNGFQNLLALNIHRGRDHGLGSYQDYRKVCGLADAEKKKYSKFDPFSIFRNEIIDSRARARLRRTYKDPSNHIDLFAAGMAESDGRNEFLGPTFKCIIGRTLTNLRDGDRFFFQNNDQFSKKQQQEVKKMTLAKVMCLTLRNTDTIQENLFDVFLPRRQKRLYCSKLLNNTLDVQQWLTNSIYTL